MCAQNARERCAFPVGLQTYRGHDDSIPFSLIKAAHTSEGRGAEMSAHMPGMLFDSVTLALTDKMTIKAMAFRSRRTSPHGPEAASMPGLGTGFRYPSRNGAHVPQTCT